MVGLRGKNESRQSTRMTRVYPVQGRKIGRSKKRRQQVINVDLEKRKLKLIDPKNRGEEWRKDYKYTWTPASRDKHLVSTSGETNG